MLKFVFPASLRVLAVIMAFSVFSAILLGLYLIAGTGLHLPSKELLAIVAAAVLLLLARRALPLFRTGIDKFFDTRHLWACAVMVGLFVRLATWQLTAPVVQINDGLQYLELAKRLYGQQGYELQGFAFWPPGTPFVYTAFMWMVGQPAWISVFVNCTFFMLTCCALRSICRSLQLTPRDAGLTVVILAIWPALFLTSPQVSKETLLVGLLPTIMALLLVRRPWASLVAGCVSGLAILTQPSLMLLPLFLLASLWAARIPVKTIALRMVLLFAGAVLVIAPWSYRNYLVMGEFVPVSTNAGLVLHAGNQPAMVKPLGEVGGFLEPAAPATALKNDAALSRWHKEEALRFILANKGDFVKLVWNRLVVTMGDDSDSAYRNLRLTNKVSDKVYLLAKAGSNGWWMILAALLAATCWSLRGTSAAHALAPLTVLAAGVTLYLMAAHGVAEGGGRHHMAWSWLYALILAAGLTRIGSDRVDASER